MEYCEVCLMCLMPVIPCVPLLYNQKYSSSIKFSEISDVRSFANIIGG